MYFGQIISTICRSSFLLAWIIKDNRNYLVVIVIEWGPMDFCVTVQNMFTQLEYMHGKTPNGLITNQDSVVQNTIDIVFPFMKYILCFEISTVIIICEEQSPFVSSIPFDLKKILKFVFTPKTFTFCLTLSKVECYFYNCDKLQNYFL